MAGRRLDPEVLGFLRRADQMLDHQHGGGDDDDATADVVENVVAQVQGHELAAACHVFASQTLQRAITAAADAHLVALATPLLASRHALTALTDKYGSHVIEALVAQVLPSLQRSSAGWEAGEPSLAALLVGLVDALVADGATALLTAMKDRYATHVVRAALRVLSGEPAAAPSGAPSHGSYNGFAKKYHLSYVTDVTVKFKHM